MSENTKESVNNVNNIDTNENNNDNVTADVAEDKTSEDTTGENYRALFEKQNNLIDTLMEQIDSYQKQIETLMRNGAVIQDGKIDTNEHVNDVTETPEYVSLADLGKEIGKR